MAELSSQLRILLAALALGLAGLVPFVAGAGSLWIAVPVLTPPLGFKMVAGYGALVLAFLGGIRWGTAIGPYGRLRQGLDFGLSVLGVVAGLAALFLTPIPALTLLIAGFLMQALWDATSVEAGRLPAWFGKLRMVLTAGAVVALIAALVAVVVT